MRVPVYIDMYTHTHAVCSCEGIWLRILKRQPSQCDLSAKQSVTRIDPPPTGSGRRRGFPGTPRPPKLHRRSSSRGSHPAFNDCHHNLKAKGCSIPLFGAGGTFIAAALLCKRNWHFYCLWVQYYWALGCKFKAGRVRCYG